MVIDVLALLKLAHERAATMAALDKPCERELSLRASQFRFTPAVQLLLDARPKLFGDQRRVLPDMNATFPDEVAAINAVAQNMMDPALADFLAGVAVDQPSTACLFGKRFERDVSCGIPTEKLSDERSCNRINLDGLAPVWARNVLVSQGSGRRPMALLGFLLHALTGFLGEIVDVILRHQHFDAVNELLRRAGVVRKDDSLFHKMNLDIEIIERHPIPEIAVKAIGLFNEHRSNVGMLLEITNHF